MPEYIYRRSECVMKRKNGYRFFRYGYIFKSVCNIGKKSFLRKLYALSLARRSRCKNYLANIVCFVFHIKIRIISRNNAFPAPVFQFFQIVINIRCAYNYALLYFFGNIHYDIGFFGKRSVADNIFAICKIRRRCKLFRAPFRVKRHYYGARRYKRKIG